MRPRYAFGIILAKPGPGAHLMVDVRDTGIQFCLLQDAYTASVGPRQYLARDLPGVFTPREILTKRAPESNEMRI